MKRIGQLALGLALFSLVAWADERIDKLAAQCQTGVTKSCHDLTSIATTGKNGLVSRAAVEKLTDRALLAAICTADLDSGVREAAVRNQNLTDQTTLARVSETGNGEVQWIAVEKLTDQTALADIANTIEEEGLRKAAVLKLIAHTILLDFATKGKSWKVREVAKERLEELRNK